MADAGPRTFRELASFTAAASASPGLPDGSVDQPPKRARSALGLVTLAGLLASALGALRREPAG